MKTTRNDKGIAKWSRALPALLALGAMALADAAHAQYTVRVMGDNYYGQAGNGTFDPAPFASATQPVGDPAYIAFSSGADHAISSGSDHTMAIDYSGTLRVWGKNGSGQVGDGTYVSRNTPYVTYFHDATACAAGGQHSLVLRSDGSVYAWGDNTFGELGLGPNFGGTNSPVRVGLANVAQIVAGDFTSAAITNNGDLYMWGEKRLRAGRQRQSGQRGPRPRS